MDILGQSALLVAITSFAIGLATLARNVRNKLFLLFALLCTLISAWALFFCVAKYKESPWFYHIHVLMNFWLAPAALAFIRSLDRMQDRGSRTLLTVSLIGAGILSVLLVMGYDKDPLILQFMFFLPAMVVLQILQLVWIDTRKRHSGDSAPRRTLVYLGGLIVLAISTLDHVKWAGLIVPSIGNLALTVYLFFLSQAVSRQRFLNLGALFSRFLVLLTIAFTLTLVYSLLFTWIANKPALFFLNSFIVSFLLLMLLEPIRSMVTFVIQRFLTQKYKDMERKLRGAQMALASIAEPGALFGAMLGTVQETLQPEWCSLFLLRADGIRLRRVHSSSGQPLTAPEILVTDPMLEHVRALQARGELPVLLDQFVQNEIDHSASRRQREHLQSLLEGLHALHANLVIPLLDQDSVLGFVVVSASSPPEPWGNNWGLLTQIYPYFEQASKIVRNLEVFARQREKERLAELGQMAAGLAHEIRNPLGAIKGAAQLLEQSRDGQESKFLKIIVEETDRLNGVVTQFLDYSKPAEIERKRVDIDALVERTIEKLRPAVPTGISVDFEPEGRGASVIAATEQIQQVLINFVQNSVRAIEESAEPRLERKIRIKVERLAARGREGFPEAMISVEDTGPGIEKRHLDKLFIPFFTTSPKGTGLGLSISQKIVEAHHGRIEVATEEGRYARFSMILPMVK